MAFVKPQINTIKADIANISIYLRSTKKFGKTTLFRDVILEKYGDPSYGLLVGCGAETGYKMLDHLNATQVTSWEDLVELKKWLIETNGVEHHIKIIAFDTGDELVLLADKKTIAISNKENPQKPCRSIKAAMGGYTAGEKYSANNLIKPYLSDLQQHGFATWVIAHTKLKTIKDKGALEEDGYQQLTSNLSADYEAAFGDVFDVCLTGVIDRTLETKQVGSEKKNVVTDTERRLYFRGTPMIDAGGRFAADTVPEYMVFDKGNMASDFIKIVEGGMEKSKLSGFKAKVKVEEKPVTKPVVNKVEEMEVEEDEPPFDADSSDSEDEQVYSLAERLAAVREAFKNASKELKDQVKAILIANGNGQEKAKLDNLPVEELAKVEAILGL
ncbi:MAG TPA: hypothetical protein DCW90_22420 [Lachnospiraceae bacterium]|nr:hypothetical protein [Lachnospiraceae bacterium]